MLELIVQVVKLRETLKTSRARNQELVDKNLQLEKICGEWKAALKKSENRTIPLGSRTNQIMNENKENFKPL